MSKISRQAREQLAKRLLEALLARLDTPPPLIDPEITLDPMKVDEDWSIFNGANPELFERKSDPATIKRLKATVSGTKSITIRVPNRVLQIFRQQADVKGVHYQTLMNSVLSEAADAMG